MICWAEEEDYGSKYSLGARGSGTKTRANISSESVSDVNTSGDEIDVSCSRLVEYE